MTAGPDVLAEADDGLLARRTVPRARPGETLLSVAASLGLHALVIAFLLLDVLARFESPTVAEIPVEVVVETPPPVPPPQAPPAAQRKDRQPNPRLMPEVADEKKTSNAMQGALERNSQGQDKTDEGSPKNGNDAQERDNPLPLTRSETADLTAPDRSAPEAHRKARAAPTGDARAKAVTRRPDQAARDTEAANKRRDITCDPNAGHNPIWGTIRHGTVVGALNADQAARAMDRSQSFLNLHISPGYVANARLAVHTDGAPPAAWVVVLLPGGMAAHLGDHIEYRLIRLDPARPCHYIPNIALRIL